MVTGAGTQIPGIPFNDASPGQVSNLPEPLFPRGGSGWGGSGEERRAGLPRGEHAGRPYAQEGLHERSLCDFTQGPTSALGTGGEWRDAGTALRGAAATGSGQGGQS